MNISGPAKPPERVSDRRGGHWAIPHRCLPRSINQGPIIDMCYWASLVFNAINVIFFVARPICAFGAEADGLMSYSADFGRPSRVRNLLFEDPFTTYSPDHRSNYCRV